MTGLLSVFNIENARYSYSVLFKNPEFNIGDLGSEQAICTSVKSENGMIRIATEEGTIRYYNPAEIACLSFKKIEKEEK